MRWLSHSCHACHSYFTKNGEIKMADEHFQLIKEKYESKGEDFTELFQTLLSVADDVGLDEALEHLGTCLIEKRLSWLDKNLDTLERTGNPIVDAYEIFFKTYLGISVPEDGDFLEYTNKKIIMRWRNHCPVLEACKKLGLDTREVCKKAYHEPTQAFLSRIDPRLRFSRNYSKIRPYTTYCEEIITLEE